MNDNINIDWVDYYNKLAFYELRFIFIDNQWEITFPKRKKTGREIPYSYKERFTFLNNQISETLTIKVEKFGNTIFSLELDEIVEYSFISNVYFFEISCYNNQLTINANGGKFQILEKVKNQNWKFVFKQFDRLEDNSVTFNDLKKCVYNPPFTPPDYSIVPLAKMILAMSNSEYELLAKNIGQFTDEETEIIAAALLQDYQFEEFINTNRIKLFGKIATICSLEYLEDLSDYFLEFYERYLLEWEFLYFEIEDRKYAYPYKPFLFDDEDKLIYIQKQEIRMQQIDDNLMKYCT